MTTYLASTSIQTFSVAYIRPILYLSHNVVATKCFESLNFHLSVNLSSPNILIAYNQCRSEEHTS